MKYIGIIFSRDRAMQLDAVLQSFFLHCQDTDNTRVQILYKTTNERHEKQYQELIRKYAGQVFFKREKKFREDLLLCLRPYEKGKLKNSVFLWLSVVGHINLPLETLFYRLWRRTVNRFLVYLANVFIGKNLKNQHVFFLVDDNIFVEDFYLKNAIETLRQKEKLLGFSLRLGKNITYCYPQRRKQFPPVFDGLGGNIYFFDWTKEDGDFGYPLEVSSSIYRLSDVFPLLMGFPFDNPNELERQLAYNASFFRKKRPYLACYQYSVTFCNPINLVQSVSPNRAGENIQFGTDDLAIRFERGERIQVKTYCGFVPKSCHQEVDLLFQKTESR